MKSKYIKIIFGIVILLLCLYSICFLYKKQIEKTNLKSEINISRADYSISKQNISENEFRVDKYYFNLYILPKEKIFFDKVNIEKNNDNLFENFLNEYIEVVKLMNEEALNKVSYEDTLSEDFKNVWVKLLQAEGNIYFALNYNFLADKYSKYISPAYYEWLKHLDKTDKIIEDAGLCVTPEELRQYIIYLEMFQEKYPEFIDLKTVKERTKNYLNLYLAGMDNTPVFSHNDKKMEPEFKQSYEKFLDENKSSKYYPAVEEFYNKAADNQFIESDEFKDWFINTFLQKYFFGENH